MTDIRTLDLNLLKTLDALLETRSVTQTATRLSLTQPTVSGMLARLRDAFGDPMFVRSQRGIIPTARAEALAGPLKAALRDIGAMLQTAAFDPARAELTVSIAATDYAQRVQILPFLAFLRTEAPGIRVSVRPVSGQDLAGQMERGVLDMALTVPGTAADTLRSRTLFSEDYVCALRADHPAAHRPLNLDTFCGFDHAIMSHDGTQFRGATDTALQAVGRSRRVMVSVPNFTVLLDLVRSSDYCALLPSRLVDEGSGLFVTEPPVAVPGFTKILVWHERTHSDQAMIWVREHLAHIAI